MPPPRGRRSGRGDDSDAATTRGRGERQLRGLEATRGTQVSPTAALRARDWAAPTDDDLAEAEREVVLVRRNYVPPAPLQTGRRRGRQRD